MSRCNFKVEENLITKLDQGDDNVPVGMPHELKWQDEILKVEKKLRTKLALQDVNGPV